MVIMIFVVVYGLNQQQYLTHLDPKKVLDIEIVHEFEWKHKKKSPDNLRSLPSRNRDERPRDGRLFLTNGR